jgi:hypothetical protein
MNRHDPLNLDPHLLLSIKQAQEHLKEFSAHERLRRRELGNLFDDLWDSNQANLRLLQDIRRDIDSLSATRQMLADFSRDLKRITRLGLISDYFNELRKTKAVFHEMELVRTEQIKAFAEIGDYLRHNRNFMANSFNAQVFAEMRELHELTDDGDEAAFAEHIERIFGLLIDHCKKLVPGTISYEGMFSIVLSLFLFFYSLSDNRATEQRITDLVSKKADEVIAEVSKLKPVSIDETLLVVERPARLQLRPRTKSPMIQVLARNQIVKLIDSAGKWIYVEYFDYVDGLPKNGWMLKKYSRRLMK